ncbi:unnamed protein product [Parnassius apollo]|uniref:(apollo) hypothetical protein n=1 Tax=Parnassius apollo TaxID=110799 RepID=A0A8S3Y004_PARAO|nr:unnamed protein product [Parnassius apollo]
MNGRARRILTLISVRNASSDVSDGASSDDKVRDVESSAAPSLDSSFEKLEILGSATSSLSPSKQEMESHAEDLSNVDPETFQVSLTPILNAVFSRPTQCSYDAKPLISSILSISSVEPSTPIADVTPLLLDIFINNAWRLRRRHDNHINKKRKQDRLKEFRYKIYAGLLKRNRIVPVKDILTVPEKRKIKKPMAERPLDNVRMSSLCKAHSRWSEWKHNRLTLSHEFEEFTVETFLFDKNNIKFGGSEELPSSTMELTAKTDYTILAECKRDSINLHVIDYSMRSENFTDRPNPDNSTQSSAAVIQPFQNIDPQLSAPPPLLTPVVSAIPMSCATEEIQQSTVNEPILTATTVFLSSPDPFLYSAAVIETQHQPSMSETVTSLNKVFSPEAIRPFPKAGVRKVNNRKRRKTAILTDTPEKEALFLEQHNKNKVIRKKATRTNKQDNSRQAAIPTSLDEVHISDIDTILDTSRKAKLKKDTSGNIKSIEECANSETQSDEDNSQQKQDSRKAIYQRKTGAQERKENTDEEELLNILRKKQILDEDVSFAEMLIQCYGN